MLNITKAAVATGSRPDLRKDKNMQGGGSSGLREREGNLHPIQGRLTVDDGGGGLFAGEGGWGKMRVNPGNGAALGQEDS